MIERYEDPLFGSSEPLSASSFVVFIAANGLHCPERVDCDDTKQSVFRRYLDSADIGAYAVSVKPRRM